MRRPVGQVVKLLLYVSVCLLALLSCEHNQPDDQPQDEASSHYYDELGLSRYDPVITLSFTGEDSVFIEEITNIHPEETLTSNRWTQLYEDVLGIRIVYAGSRKEIRIGRSWASPSPPVTSRMSSG